MNQIEMSRLLDQMRVMAGQARAMPQPLAKTGEPAGADFAALLQKSINAVSETQQQASALAKAFEQGDSQVHLNEVMLALQKASISFQAMTQVRNKLIEAYQDIKNMPI